MCAIRHYFQLNPPGVNLYYDNVLLWGAPVFDKQLQLWTQQKLRRICEIILLTFQRFQVLLDAGQRQRGVSDHDGPAGGDGVRHRGAEAAAVRPDRPKPGEQKPSQAAAQEVRSTWSSVG